MTPTQLEVFVAVSEIGSFTLAAQVLSMTQSGVSHAVAALEAELGVGLIQRDRMRRCAVTGAGERVLEHARQVLASFELIRQEAAAWRGLDTGMIRVGAFASAAARLLPRVLRDYARRYPGVELRLHEGTDDEVHDWILSRAVDVGFVTLPAPGLHVVEVACDEMLAVLPAGHMLERESGLEPAQLAGEPFIMSTGGCEPMIRAIFATAGVAPTIRYVVRDMGTILAMVAEGLGITMAPELALPAQQPGVTVVPLIPPVRRRLALGVRSSVDVPPAVSALLRLAPAIADGSASDSWVEQGVHTI